LKIPPHYDGRRAYCKHCNTKFTIHIPESSRKASSERAPAPADARGTATWESGSVVAEGLSESLKKLEQENTVLREERDGFRARFERARSSLNTALAEAEELPGLRLELDEVRAERDTLRHQLAELDRIAKEHAETCVRHEAEAVRLAEASNAAREAWETERRVLREESSARHEEVLREADGFRLEAEALRNELGTARSSHDQALDALGRERDKGRDELALARQTLSGLEQERDTTRQGAEEAQRQAEEHARVGENLRSELEQMRRDLERKELESAAQIGELSRALEAAAETSPQVAERCRTLENELQQFADARTALLEELAASNRRLEELKTQYASSLEYAQRMRSHLAGMGIRVPG
jgi:chromosome segregation ATPase